MGTKLDASDKFFEVASLAFLSATFLIITLSIPSLPDIIPSHFDMSGEPNQYSPKYIIWVAAAISVFIYILISIISRFPEKYNYPSQKINKEAQYKLGGKLMRSFKASILFFLTIVTWMMVRSAHTGTAKGAFWLIALVVLILGVNFLWFFIKWRKIK